MADRGFPSERGAGLVGLLGGFLVVLLLLLVATHVAFGLYARSVTAGLGSDAAREVAGFDNVEDRSSAAASRTTELRAALSDLSDDVSIEWGDLSDPDVVVLRITGTPKSFVSGVVSGLASVSLHRTFTVRVEDFGREPDG